MFLSPLDVHLWLVDTRRPPGSDMAEAPAVLSDDERDRAARFHFDRDRLVFVAAHVFLRRCLSLYRCIDPAAWTFVRNAWGKPELAKQPDVPPLRFNLSHSGPFVACVVAQEIDVGVDLERIDAARASDALVARVLGGGEPAAFAAIDASDRPRMFARYWTLKEAYVKATGIGLSLDVRDVRFSLGRDGGPGVSFGASLDDRPERWQFWQPASSAEYVVSVAARGPAGAHLQLVDQRDQLGRVADPRGA